MSSALLVGLGKFSLGFVCPLLSSEGLKVVGARRKGSSRKHYKYLRRSYSIQLNDGTFEEHKLAKVIAYSSASEAVERLGEAPAILAISVGSDSEIVAFEFLSALFDKFSPDYMERPLLFVPFENDPRVGSRVLSLMKKRGIGEITAKQWCIFTNALVDRICANVEVKNEHCVVRAERYQELALLSLNGRQHSFFSNAYCDEDRFSFLLRRKYWAVNGMQLALGLLSLQEEVPITSTVAAALSCESIRSSMQEISDEISQALTFLVSENNFHVDNSTEIQSYVSTALERICAAGEDTIQRYLKPLLELPQLVWAAFHEDEYAVSRAALDKWYARILEPTTMLLRHAGKVRRRASLLLPQLHNELSQRIIDQTYSMIASRRAIHS